MAHRMTDVGLSRLKCRKIKKKSYNTLNNNKINISVKYVQYIVDIGDISYLYNYYF